MMDCVSKYFSDIGCDVCEETLGNSLIPLGQGVVWNSSKFTYRVADNALMIVFYERVGSRTGLHSGFVDLIEWVNEIKDNVPEIVYVTGKVDALRSSNTDSELSNRKLHRFYRDIMQASLAEELGESWYRFEISRLENFRSHYKGHYKRHYRNYDKSLTATA